MSHRDGRGASLARRDDREYREYLREEQRSQRGCVARRMQPDFHHGLVGLAALINRETDMRLVATATTVETAVRQFTRHRPNVTLIDAQLGRGNGIDAVTAPTRCRPAPPATSQTSSGTICSTAPRPLHLPAVIHRRQPVCAHQGAACPAEALSPPEPFGTTDRAMNSFLPERADTEPDALSIRNRSGRRSSRTAASTPTTAPATPAIPLSLPG